MFGVGTGLFCLHLAFELTLLWTSCTNDGQSLWLVKAYTNVSAYHLLEHNRVTGQVKEVCILMKLVEYSARLVFNVRPCYNGYCILR